MKSHQESIFMSLPVSLFGSTMGLCGLSVALNHFAHNVPFFQPLVRGVDMLTFGIFLFLSCIYLVKWLAYFHFAKEEFQCPTRKSFFATITISLLLTPILIHKYNPTLSFYIWLLGVVLSFIFALYMVYFWIETKHSPTQLTPAWIIPVVGVLNIPQASYLFHGNYLHFVNLSALAIGFFFAIPVITLIFSRVIFIEKLPAKLTPTLMILVAPFSVGHLAYVATVGVLDGVAFGLFIIGVFMFFALLPQLFKITKVAPFQVSWWAISFPTAALINSLYSINHFLKLTWLENLTNAALLVFTAIVIYLIYRTIKGIYRKEFACFC